MIKRITITIKKDILKRIDSTIDGKKTRNRSHAIENLLVQSIGKTDLDTALILAGGLGAQLRPITYEIPKPMIPIHGKPILEHQINMLKRHGIKNIILSVGYMHDKVREYFGDGSKFGVNIDYIIEDKSMGTAWPLQAARDLITGTFVVLNVDTLMDPNISEILEFHRSHDSLGTILLVTTEDTKKSGVAVMRGNSVTEFTEKPKAAKSSLTNAGLYVLEPAVIDMISKKKGFIEKDLLPKLSSLQRLSGFLHDGPIFDIGNHSGYERAIKQWKSMK